MPQPLTALAAEYSIRPFLRSVEFGGEAAKWSYDDLGHGLVWAQAASTSCILTLDGSPLKVPASHVVWIWYAPDDLGGAVLIRRKKKNSTASNSLP